MSEHSTILPHAPAALSSAASESLPDSESGQKAFAKLPFHNISVQFKLSVSAPDDALEHEADATSNTVIQRKPLVSFIQKKQSASSGTAVSDSITARINASRGNGSSLDSPTQSFMQDSFGADFSQVKIHTGAESIQMNRELNAKAFTVGNDIYFNEGQYAPGSGEGKHLLAHELTHTIQQGSSATEQISRTPGGRTAEIHQELIEQYRRENGLPPHGIDSFTGQQVGPTDSEIRFGGLLDAWLSQRSSRATGATQSGTAQSTSQAVRSVNAPAVAPVITPPGTTNVVAACQGAPDVGACRQHQSYVQNILPQVIQNIRQVTSPYSNAIAAMYTAALPQAQAAAAPVPAAPPASFGQTVNATGGPVTVTFGATTHTFTQFTITLQQFPNGANGQAFGAGGPVAFISLNEISNDALFRNLAGIEATMVHEAIHILMEIVETANSARAAGTPLVNPNLDRSSYATVQTALEAALLPFINQVRQLPNFATANGTAQTDSRLTARSFLSEAIARAEAGIFEKQRAGQSFTPADLRALPVFIHTDSYWLVSTPNVAATQDLKTFIQNNQAQIDATILPLIHQAGDTYLNLRP